jgi:hypothetical protein
MENLVTLAQGSGLEDVWLGFGGIVLPLGEQVQEYWL